MPLTVVVGSNASGKTNLADCIDFMSEVYQHGLEVAVARKGGYENIAHRRERRAKGAVVIETVSQFDVAANPLSESHDPRRVNVIAKHRFAFQTHGSSIAAEFRVVAESFELWVQPPGDAIKVLSIDRKRDAVETTVMRTSEFGRRAKSLVGEFANLYLRSFELVPEYVKQVSSPTELIVTNVGRVIPLMRLFMRSIGGVRVFQISPSSSREYGVPTPGPELDRSGHNLPAVIDLLQKRHPNQWRRIMSGMTRILPDLQKIDVTYSSSRTLALQFHEKGVGKPWNVTEISDGTMQTLALLVALFDPRSTGLVIEEPENSVHPWIIRSLIEACEEATTEKQVLITTHSPTVMNGVKPEQLVVMWKERGASRVAPITRLDADFKSLWESGEVATFEYIDSGALWQAIPLPPDDGDKD